jgi:hypothetical protein
MRTALRAVGAGLLLVLLAGGYWTYCLIWGRPFNFDDLIERQAIFYLLDDPVILTSLGIVDGTMLDYHSDKLTPFTPEFRAKRQANWQTYRDEIQGYDRASLTPQQQTTYDVMLWTIDTQLRYQRFPWLTDALLYPFDQLFGTHTFLPRFMQSGGELCGAPQGLRPLLR